MRVLNNLIALAVLLACSEPLAAGQNKRPHPSSADLKVSDREHFTRGHNKRSLRLCSDLDEKDDNSKTGKVTGDDEEERDFIISTVNHPKYHRWFHDHMTPYDVKEELGLTGLRPIVKPIKRRVYKGYVVYYEEHCHEPEYMHMEFCQADSDW
ncbi:unnamed protein product [Phytophthora fragariaefolia]|uniref:RxLR effector protein n=1 Tax=Phytophthora fragariaefolia TaxID=1490495 RepID=A0A9W6U5Y1_9STRA|nr:unnamed protein product [Phytophthora fragariaefolia]